MKNWRDYLILIFIPFLFIVILDIYAYVILGELFSGEKIYKETIIRYPIRKQIEIEEPAKVIPAPPIQKFIPKKEQEKKVEIKKETPIITEETINIEEKEIVKIPDNSIVKIPDTPKLIIQPIYNIPAPEHVLVSISPQEINPIPVQEEAPKETIMPDPIYTLQTISPMANKGLGREYLAREEEKDEFNYVYLGLLIENENGQNINNFKVEITATDESQNKILTSTGNVTKIWKNGAKKTIYYYPFNYSFKTPGTHKITFSVPHLNQKEEVIFENVPLDERVNE